MGPLTSLGQTGNHWRSIFKTVINSMNNLTSFSVPWRQTRMNSSGLVQSCLFDIKLSETPCPRQFLIRTFWSSSPSLWWSTYIERMQLGSISDLHAWARFRSLNWNAMHPLRTPTDLTVAFIHSAKHKLREGWKRASQTEKNWDLSLFLSFSPVRLWRSLNTFWTNTFCILDRYIHFSLLFPRGCPASE